MVGSKRRYLQVGFTLVAIFAGIYIWFFGWNLMFFFQAHRMGKESPVVYSVPSPLPDSSTSHLRVQQYAIGNYEFEVPWSNLQPIQRKVPENWLVFTSPSGIGLMVIRSDPKTLVKTFNQRDPKSGMAMQDIYGPEVLKDDYALTRYMLETTPADIRAMASRKENVARSMMLTIKAITIPESAESAIFYIQTPEFRGFQFGDSTKSPKKIVVELFSEECKVEFWFTKKDRAADFPQSEINEVLQSLHKRPK